MPVKPIPDGYHTLTPVLTVHGATKLIEFLKQAFDATAAPRESATINAPTTASKV